MTSKPQPKPRPQPRFATRIPKRRPEWKFHSNVGLAKNALRCMVRYGELWEIDEDGNYAEEPLYVVNPNDPGALYNYKWREEYLPWVDADMNRQSQLEHDIKVANYKIDRCEAALKAARKELQILMNQRNG